MQAQRSLPGAAPLLRPEQQWEEEQQALWEQKLARVRQERRHTPPDRRLPQGRRIGAGNCDD
jgi:hypothetical protein